MVDNNVIGAQNCLVVTLAIGAEGQIDAALAEPLALDKLIVCICHRDASIRL